MFFWEGRLSKPRGALVKKGSASAQIMLYTGQSYDLAAFDLLKGGWKHDYCGVCFHPIYPEDRPKQSLGYTNGQQWVCERCYALIITPGV